MVKQYCKITIVVDKDLAEWIKKKSKMENRSINNFIETLLLSIMEKEKGEFMCISRQS
ncbi:MAG: hypothetical protein QXG39_06235 [Candidatus Aenigmatarchaeota archaeon]